MCGIAGIYNRNQAVNQSVLEQLAQALHHRGPDDSGYYLKDNYGLVHTRLSIVDLQTGHQPFTCNNSGLILIANGEIYNAPELREQLEKAGRIFKTSSDCEVILHAYAVFGAQNFLDHIEGMFAFALYDQRNQMLLLARDRVGMKPLFVCHGTDGIAFASEIKALLPLLPTKDINPNSLVQYLQYQFSSGRQTILKDIERILPGEYMIIKNGEVTRRHQYWSATQVQPVNITMAQAQEQFDDLMQTVIQQHMRSDVPFGLFLSGGIDSSILLACLRQQHQGPLATFSVGYPDSGVKNELPTASRLAAEFNCDHTIIEPDLKSSLQGLPQVIWAADDLMADSANLPTALLAQTASHKLKVIFTGEGGDEAFAGYGRYRSHAIQRGLKRLIHPQGGGFRTRGMFRNNWLKELATPTLYHYNSDARQPMIDAWQKTPKQWQDIQKRQFVDITTELADDLLVKADRMLMLHGIEGRLPFCDRRIVEFGLSLPAELKVKSGIGKLFLRQWAQRHLPSDILSMKKRGFSVPVQSFLTSTVLQNLGEVLPRHEAIKQWFQPEKVKQLMQQQQSGKFNHSSMIWSIFQFTLWYEMFINGNGERPSLLSDPVMMLAANH